MDNQSCCVPGGLQEGSPWPGSGAVAAAIQPLALAHPECQNFCARLLNAEFSMHNSSEFRPKLAETHDIAALHMEDCMQFRPLHDRVVVRRISAEEKTAGGIIIPDTAKEKPQEGEIVAAGPGARN